MKICDSLDKKICEINQSLSTKTMLQLEVSSFHLLQLSRWNSERIFIDFRFNLSRSLPYVLYDMMDQEIYLESLP